MFGLEPTTLVLLVALAFVVLKWRDVSAYLGSIGINVPGATHTLSPAVYAAPVQTLSVPVAPVATDEIADEELIRAAKERAALRAAEAAESAQNDAIWTAMHGVLATPITNVATPEMATTPKRAARKSVAKKSA
jgi:hypothetical protein